MPDEPITAAQLSDFMKVTQQRLGNLETNTPLSYHIHNGFDMNKVNYSDLSQRQIWINHNIYGATAATATNYSVFYISTFPATITAFREVHTTAGTDGSAVTIQLEKLTSTTAPGSGSNVLSSALSLKATANTVQTGSLTTTLANVNIATGDRLAIKLSGTPTSVANVSVLVALTF